MCLARIKRKCIDQTLWSPALPSPTVGPLCRHRLPRSLGSEAAPGCALAPVPGKHFFHGGTTHLSTHNAQCLTSRCPSKVPIPGSSALPWNSPHLKLAISLECQWSAKMIVTQGSQEPAPSKP